MPDATLHQLEQESAIERSSPARQTVLAAALLFLAILSAGALVWGTRPELGNLPHGIECIVLVRRIQWLLVGVSLVCCLGVITLVITNLAGIGFLLGLAPVLAFFAMRFGPIEPRASAVLDLPVFVSASHPDAPQNGDWVVGLLFESEPYAFPYASLYQTPLVVVTDYSRRMLLIWSARANRALAFQITRDLRPRALEIVSTPLDALLIFERRYGQFISSITGRTMDGHVPIGFGPSIPVTKTTWSAWRAQHPRTRVLLPFRSAGEAPTRPLVPEHASGPDARMQVIVLNLNPPAAIACERVCGDPLNLTVGTTRVLLLRDPLTGAVRAFDRRVEHDLFPRFFKRAGTATKSELVLVDADTQSLWNSEGQAVQGPLKGQQLRSIPSQDGLYWGVMKRWYPEIVLIP